MCAKGVGAEQGGPRPGLQPVDGIDLVDAVGRQRRRSAAEQEQQEHHAADGAERLLAEQPADEVPDGAGRPAALKGLACGWASVAISDT
jgi:hypothetical protein